MTIIIDHDITSFGSTSAIAIWAVTGEDGGLGEVPVPGQPTFSRVTYTPTRGGFGPTRINALVNDTTDVTVVRGVDSTFTFLDPTGASRPITDFVGITFEEVVGGGTRLIRVIYDATQCGGKNYFAFDAAGNQIEVPTPIVVGHELAHAFHILARDVPPGLAAAEIQAQTDENVIRADLGLPLRDINNHGGGCGFTPPPPPPPNGPRPGWIDCFIASAAYGSPYAREVNRFRQIRDTFLRRSTLGYILFADLFAEYYSYSPLIAKDMATSPALRASISTLFVEPLLSFFDLFEQYVRGGWQQETYSDRVENALERSRADLVEAGMGQEDIELISRVVAELKGRVDGYRGGLGLDEYSSISSRDDDNYLVLNYLASVVTQNASSTRYTSWALLWPLTLYWSTLTQDKETQQGPEIGRNFIGEMEQWLAAVPMPSAFAQMSRDEIAESLAQLAETVFTIPMVRLELGRRMLEDYGDRVPYDLKTLLEEVGYVSSQVPRREIGSV